MYELKTDHFSFEYHEGIIVDPMLWQRHCHAQFEMIAVLEGDISVMLEGTGYRVTENQTVMIPPLLYHTVTVNHSGMYRRVLALFEISAVPQVLREWFLNKKELLAISFSPQLRQLEEICQRENPTFYAPLAESLMVQAFYRDWQAQLSLEAEESDELVQQMIRYVDRHLHEKITLADLASHTARSQSSISHLFAEKMNIPPMQYVMEKKLAYANRLIRSGTPPGVAAMQVGYENYSNFYRLYRKRFHEKPSSGSR